MNDLNVKETTAQTLFQCFRSCFLASNGIKCSASHGVNYKINSTGENFQAKEMHLKVISCPMRLSDDIVVSKPDVASYGFFRNLFLAS